MHEILKQCFPATEGLHLSIVPAPNTLDPKQLIKDP